MVEGAAQQTPVEEQDVETVMAELIRYAREFAKGQRAYENSYAAQQQHMANIRAMVPELTDGQIARALLAGSMTMTLPAMGHEAHTPLRALCMVAGAFLLEEESG